MVLLVWAWLCGAQAGVTVSLPATDAEVVFDDTAQAAVEQGMQALSSGRFDAAGRSFRALAEAGGGLSARYLEAMAWYEGGQLRLSEKAVQRVLEVDSQHGPALSLYGLVLADTGRGQEALRILDKALGRARVNGDQRLEAQVVLNQGLVHLDMGELGRARQTLTQAVELARAVPDDALVASAQENLGTVAALTGEGGGEADPVAAVAAHLRKGELDEARAAVPRPSEHDRRGQVRALLADALVDRTAGRLDDANAKLRTALGLAREGGLVRETAACLAELGTLYSLGGRFDVALQLYQEAVGLVAGTSFRLREVAYRVEAGRVAVRLGDMDQANNQLEVAAMVAGRIEDPLGQARIEELQGQIDERTDRPEQAASHLESAITTYERFGHTADVARVSTELAAVWAGRDAGRTRKAESQALRAFQAVNNPAGPAHVQVSLGLGYARRGDLDRALQAFLKAAELGEALGTERGTQIASHARENAAQALKALGHTDDLADEMAQATELEGVMARQEAFQAAEQAYKRGLDAYNEGRHGQAVAAFTEAVKGFSRLGERGHASTSRRGRGWAMRSAALLLPADQALPYLEQAEQDALAVGDTELRVKARTGAALAAAELERKDATRRLTEAAELAESAGLNEEAGLAYARIAEVATSMDTRASAARRAYDLRGTDDAEAVYAMYSVAVDAYNAGDAELALSLAQEIAPHAGSLAEAVEGVRSAAEQSLTQE